MKIRAANLLTDHRCSLRTCIEVELRAAIREQLLREITQTLIVQEGDVPPTEAAKAVVEAIKLQPNDEGGIVLSIADAQHELEVEIDAEGEFCRTTRRKLVTLPAIVLPGTHPVSGNADRDQ